MHWAQDKLETTYEVLGKRRCGMANEELGQGTDVFVIETLVAVIERFGLVEDNPPALLAVFV